MFENSEIKDFQTRYQTNEETLGDLIELIKFSLINDSDPLKYLDQAIIDTNKKHVMLTLNRFLPVDLREKLNVIINKISTPSNNLN